MRDSTYKLIVTLLSLVILIGGGMLLYQNLQDEIDPDALIPTETASEPAQNAAPDFTVTDPEGRAVKLSDFRGKPVVVNFWASWCGPCKLEMPHFQAAYEKYGDEIQFLMVNMSTYFGDTAAEAEAVLTDGGYTFPVYYDTNAECAVRFGITGIPVSLFIDAEGNLVNSQMGMISESELLRRIEAIAD